LTHQQLRNSKFSLEELKARGRVGARNWHWVAIPVEVKHDPKKAAFLFRDPTTTKKKKKKKTSSSAAKPSQSPPCPGAVEDRPLGASDSSVPTGLHGQAQEEEQTDDTAGAADRQEPADDVQGADPPDGQPETPEAKKFVRESIEGEAALAQFAEYVLNVLNHQHRLFCYAIYICGRMARLCYFDRDGAIISKDFNWTTTDSPLHDFLWKVACMTREDLGYDPTATLLDVNNLKETESFKAMANNPSVPPAVQEYVKAATAEGVPIYKLSIIPMSAPPDEGLPDDPSSHPDQSSDRDTPSPTPGPFASPTEQSTGSDAPSPAPDSSPSPPTEPQERHFLVGKPHFVTDSLVGRCTRGYVAYNLDTGRLCFLKDYWRPYVPGRTRPEHLVLELLNRSKVRHVATLICGGDVAGLRAQQTKVQVLLDHMKAPPVPRIHYRLATEEIGLPLEDFRDFRQLAGVFRNAILAHQDAWTKAKVLHRDISVGNILIDALTKRGILIDWDLARFQCELASGPTEPDRTGTWQFRSALLLAYPRKPQRLSDDLESFIHAFYYLVLKYHPTTTISLKDFVKSTFEGASVVRGVKVGGQAKLGHFASVRPPFKVRNNAVLQAVLDAFHKGCYESYQQINFDEMDARYAIHEPQLDAPPRVPDADEDKDEDDAFSDEEPDNSETRVTMAASESQAGSVDGDRGDEVSEVTGRDASDRGHSDASAQDVGTESDSEWEASDPCVVTGFLSEHRHLTKILLDKYKPVKRLDDKRPNQFLFRSKVLAQDILEVAPRPVSRDIGSLSVSSNPSWDLVPSNLYHSPDYSSSDVPTFASATGKRTREPQDETGGPDRQVDDTADGENVDLPRDSGRHSRKKRQRVGGSPHSGVER
ncbi:hypothetical protein C8T65DRAFT_656851, partial [Cerioporus squamosus]